MTSVERLSTDLTDRYRLERELGAGRMATVFLAHDIRHERRVALKVLRPELAAVIGAERFLHEIRTTANLQRPHILPLFDSGEVDSLLYYVMPYVVGESERDKLQREKQLPIDEAVGIARAVASALDYAHRRGVIHRDIKPENVLLHDGQAVVTDASRRTKSWTPVTHQVGLPRAPGRTIVRGAVRPPAPIARFRPGPAACEGSCARRMLAGFHRSSLTVRR